MVDSKEDISVTYWARNSSTVRRSLAVVDASSSAAVVGVALDVPHPVPELGVGLRLRPEPLQLSGPAVQPPA